MFYTFCFSLPEDTNIFELAESLLRKDVARFATATHSGELRVALRFRKLEKTRKQATALVEWEKVASGKIGYAAWALKHPRLGVAVLRRMIVAWITALVRGHGSHDEVDGAPRAGKFSDVARGTIKFIDDAMNDARLALGVRDAIDRKFYASAYLEEVPFIRLELEPTHVTSRYFDDEPLECHLLLHRSGVATLSFAIATPEELTTDELIAISTAESTTFRKTRIPTSLSGERPLPAGDATKDEIGTERQSGVIWRTTTWRDAMSLSELFTLYQTRILEAIGRRTFRKAAHSEWFCYPLIAVNGLRCCKSRKRWMRNHREELAGLLLRVPTYKTLSSEATKDLPHDESLTRDESRYFEISHALTIGWHFDGDPGPDMVHDLWTVVLIENMLLQQWQLRKLSWLLSSSQWSSEGLFKAQEVAISGIVEYRRSMVSFGSAQATVRRILARFETDRLYTQIMDRLDMLAQLVMSRSADSAARRNVLVASLGFLAAMVFGLPAISATLELLSEAASEGPAGSVLGLLKTASEKYENLAWMLYGALIGVSLIIVAGAARWRSNLRRTQAAVTRFGVPWGSGDFRVLLSERKYRHGRPLAQDRRGRDAMA